MADVCGTCGQRHVRNVRLPRGEVRELPTCSGHVVTDRTTYVKGQDRKKLDKPRPCGRARPPGEPDWKCGKHGGAAPQVKRAKAKRAAEAKAEAVMRRFGEPIDTTPSEALLDTVKWTAGYVAWLREKVSEIDSDRKLVWGVTRKKTGGDDRGTTRAAAPNAWLDLLGTWHDKLVRVCAEAIKAGIEERKVRLAEAQGDLLAQVIRGVLADLHLNAEQEALVNEVVPRHLRAVAG